MKDFYIQVTETLQRIVKVKADDLDEAFDKVEDYMNEGEGLNYEDFVGRNFKDFTEYCEDRNTDIKDCFFEIPYRTSREKVLQTIQGHIDYIYLNNPNIDYDTAFQALLEYTDIGAEMMFVKHCRYNNGWTGPAIAVCFDDDLAKNICILVNKDNKIYIDKN